MKCACPCREEFEPKRDNQVYLNAEHRQRDKNRRWPRKRHALYPVTSRDGLGKQQEAKLAGVPPHPGTEMAQATSKTLQKEKRRKRVEDPGSAGMLNTFEVARLLRVSYYTLGAWRKAGIGPPFVRFSHNVIRYSWRALQRYVLRRTQNRGRLGDHGKDS